MTLIRTVAPTAYPVSLVEVKSHCNISHSDNDAKLDQFIAAATQHLDGATGVLNRAIMVQTWELWKEEFPRCHPFEFAIPLPPLIAVEEVAYLDYQDQWNILNSSDYQVVKGGNLRSRLRPAFGTCWPVNKCQPDSIKITFTAGYLPGKVPETIKQAILLAVSHWYENREAYTDMELLELPYGVSKLLAAGARLIPV